MHAAFDMFPQEKREYKRITVGTLEAALHARVLHGFVES
jgi:hypothetical protein